VPNDRIGWTIHSKRRISDHHGGGAMNKLTATDPKTWTTITDAVHESIGAAVGWSVAQSQRFEPKHPKIESLGKPESVPSLARIVSCAGNG